MDASATPSISFSDFQRAYRTALRRGYARALGSYALVVLPAFAFMGVMFSVIEPGWLSGSSTAPTSGSVDRASDLLLGLATSLAEGLVVMHVREPTTSLSDAFVRASSRMPHVFGCSLVVGLASGLGGLLFLVPGAVIWSMLCATTTVSVLERTTLSESLGRSTELTRGARPALFFSYLSVWTLSLVVFGLVFVAVALASTLFPGASDAAMGAVSMGIFALWFCVAHPASLLVAPTLYDLRVAPSVDNVAMQAIFG